MNMSIIVAILLSVIFGTGCSTETFSGSNEQIREDGLNAVDKTGGDLGDDAGDAGGSDSDSDSDLADGGIDGNDGESDDGDLNGDEDSSGKCIYFTNAEAEYTRARIVGGPPLDIDVAQYTKGGRWEGTTYFFSFQVYHMGIGDVLGGLGGMGDLAGGVTGGSESGWAMSPPGGDLGKTYVKTWFEAKIKNAKSKKCKVTAKIVPKSMLETGIELRDNVNGGCFDGDTMIKMAGGFEQKVSELTLGELVLNPVTNKTAPVVRITKGPEASVGMYEVTANGKTVVVTSKHPFLTTNGPKQARQLTSRDRIIGQGGVYHKVTRIKQRAANASQVVYNFALGTGDQTFGAHQVLANGIVTGDLIMQEALEEPARPMLAGKSVRAI